MLRSASTAIWLALVIGCGFKPTAPVSEQTEFFDRVDERTLSQSGMFLFRSPLRNLTSAEHYVIETAFLGEAGDWALHSHFNGFPLRDGVRVSVHLQDERLELRLSSPGVTDQRFDLPSDWLTADRRLKLRVEVHNQTASGPRVLIWKYTLSLHGETEQSRPYISAGNADFDSEQKNLVLPTHGRGVRWGIETRQVRLLKAYREAPYVH